MAARYYIIIVVRNAMKRVIVGVFLNSASHFRHWLQACLNPLQMIKRKRLGFFICCTGLT